MKKHIVILLICLLFAQNAVYAHTANKNIRVGIITNTTSFSAAATDSFTVTDSDKRKFSLTKGKIVVSVAENGLKIGKYIIKPPVKIESSNGIVFADKKPYRGHFIVNTIKGKLVVINVISVENYLKGVLPKEASPSWGQEALKAQAVISRTYTLEKMGRHGGMGFDICNTTHCQVYGGASCETPNTNKAVVDTKNEVLVYGGKLAQTVFHASCGGHTEDPRYVWNWKGEAPVYLRGVKCGYCDGAPHAVWEKTLDESFIRQKLSKYGVGKIKSISVDGVTPAGAAKKIMIKHSNGNLSINAYTFRLDVDAWKIKSTTFDYIKKDGGKISFKGKGWGHKVGLCQWGAKGMADKGKKYKDILGHYYPKTKIEKVKYK